MLRNIFNTFANCFKIPELKSRLLFTIGVLVIVRLASFITIPGLDGTALAEYFAKNQQGSGGLLGMYNTFAGGAYERCAVAALGIMPYISATIILQLMTAVIPQLSKMSREEGGRTKIVQLGRVMTVFLCLGQGMYFAAGWENPAKQFPGFVGTLVLHPGWWYLVEATIIMTTGTMLLMWLGEQITDRGVGNGVSLIITIGIIARMPTAYTGLKDMFGHAPGAEPTHHLMGTGIMLLVLSAVVIGGVIAVTQAQRKIPVQYAQRAVGRKLYSGGTSFFPIRVNFSGVMPIIFAQSILMFPGPVCHWVETHTKVPFLQNFFGGLAMQLNYGSFLYVLVYSLMIIFFSYFWVATQFNEIQIADDLKKNGGYIPGVRPGQGTSDYLHNSMSRITLAGAFFLMIIATIPIVLYKQMNVDQNVASFFGGTSILITVGVLLDTMRQVESHLLMRHYDGFLRKGRLRGRF